MIQKRDMSCQSGNRITQHPLSHSHLYDHTTHAHNTRTHTYTYNPPSLRIWSPSRNRRGWPPSPPVGRLYPAVFCECVWVCGCVGVCVRGVRVREWMIAMFCVPVERS